MPRQCLNLKGQRFARLLVLEMLPSQGNGTRARCMCDCGNEVVSMAYNVRNGNTKSCGCLARESSRATGIAVCAAAKTLDKHPNATHGMSKSKTYSKWLDARKRCFRVKDTHYAEYGGRGITMCQRWAESFEAFLEDMGECPDGLTLERDDVDGHYEPNNCRWASKLEQARNKRRVKATWEIACAIRARGPNASTAALAEEFGLSSGVVWHIKAGTTWKTPTSREAATTEGD